jgi:hypothetical protein
LEGSNVNVRAHVRVNIPATILLALALLLPVAPALASEEQEPNDSFAQAIEVLNDTESWTGNLSTTDNADMYKVMLNRTPDYFDSIQADMNKLTSGGQLRVYLYDSLGYRLSWNSTTGTGVITVSGTAPQTGYVYIVALLWSSNVAVGYQLDFKRTNNTQNLSVLDSDNLPGDAVIVQNGYTNDTYLDQMYDAADYYLIGLDVQPAYRDSLAVFVEMPLGGDYVVELYRPGNSSYVFVADEGNIFTPDFGINETLYYIPQDAGDYLIRIWAEHGAGNYTMSVRVFRGFSDNDNELANATTLTQDGDNAGNVTLNYDTEDYYRILLRSDTTVNLTLTVLDYDTNVQLPVINLWLLDPSHNFVNSSTAAQSVKKVGHIVVEPGWYFIKVGAARNSAGAYALDMTTVQPPEVLIPEVSVVFDEDNSTSVDLATVFQDPRALPLDYNVSQAQHMNITLTCATLNVVPQPDWSGREVLLLTATNMEGKISTATLNITVRPVNDAPRPLHADLNFIMDEDATFTLPMSVFALFDDVDGDSLAYTVDGTVNLAVAIDPLGAVVITPAKDWYGTETFYIVASDPANATAQVGVTMKVVALNDPPVVVWSPGNLTFAEDASTSIDLRKVFADPDGDALAYSVTGNLLLNVTIVGGNATVKPFYSDWFGSESVTFMARDTANASVALIVNFTVTPVNDPPRIWRNIPNMIIQEDQTVRLFNLSTYFKDVDAEKLIFTSSGSTHVGVTIGPDDWVTFSPMSNWSGTELLVFVAEDPLGERAQLEFNLTVEPVDDAPELGQPSVTPTKGDTATSFTFTVVCKDIDSTNVAVKLIVGRRIFTMERVSGNLTVGATYQIKTTLDAGDNPFFFQAEDGEKKAATSSQELTVDAKSADNTVIYIGLAVITLVVILLALVFTPSRRKRDWEEMDEEE